MPRENPCHDRYAGCNGVVPKGATRCDSCRAEHNRRARERRRALRKAGICIVEGCGAPVAKTKKAPTGGIARRQRRVNEPATCCKKHLDYFSQRAAQAKEQS